MSRAGETKVDPARPRKAWVTGAAGLIGRAICATKTSASAGFEIIPLDRQVLDLTDFKAVEARFRKDQPAVVLHCGAMAKSPDCQAHPERAQIVNVEVTALLAGLAAEADFIFFSTDLLFDGLKGNYSETDAINPLSVYADTKAAAEKIVLANPRHTVIRTSLNSGRTRNETAYNEQLVAAWRAGKTLNLFIDEYRCPIPATVTARAAWELAAQRARGLFHLAGSERLSRVQIGELAASRHPEVKALIRQESLREYRGAPRSPDVSMNCAKIRALLSFPLPGLTEYLRDHPEEPF